MNRPLSNDLRERVVAASRSGESCRSVVARFGVAVSSVVKWSQRHLETGTVAPGQMGGNRKNAFWTRTVPSLSSGSNRRCT